MKNSVFTIGHTNHPIEHFLHLLELHKIEAVADVRSSPFSRFNSQYNRENLQVSLKAAGIRYVFLGKELGARSDDQSCYLDNKVRYDRLAKTALFHSGIDRVMEGADTYRMALMCAEKEPLDCHRTILVARELDKRRIKIQHILADGSLEKHSDCINRLISQLGLSDKDMFASGNESQDLAYAKQAEKIAYERV
jgi:uncharacterized protein (DUF488 family)